MERTDILELMSTLKLYGMRAEERERDPWPICLDATPLQNLQTIT
jgi:hypothetical protein